MKVQKNKIYKIFDKKENEISLELNFKKILSVIFQYHKNKKTIIFLGLPNRFANKQHLFLPQFYWIRGLLTNKRSLFKYMKKAINYDNKNILKQYFSLNKIPDLFVIFDSKPNNALLKEALKLKIPVIFLGSQFTSRHKILYQISLNKKTIKYNKFITNLLYSILSK